MARFFRSAALIAVMLLAALVAASALENEYTPSDSTLAGLSADQAQNSLLKILPHWLIDPNHSDLAPPIAHVNVGLSRIDIVDSHGHAASLTLDKAVIATAFATTFLYQDRVEVNGITLMTPSSNKQEAMAVTDALYVLRRNLQGASPQGDATFAQAVADYRAANPKPILPEEARRFEVQAKGAIQDGDFTDAAIYYGQALQVAPWWPGGHFNRAAVLAELSEYPLAIGEMQRYLLLAPDAPDARASQDKIYNWERLGNKAAAPAPPPPRGER